MNDVREADLEPDESGLPGGTFGQLLPFLILGSGALWLAMNWDTVPLRVPMHWDAHGQVNHYVAKDPLRVGMPLIIAACVCLMLHFMSRMIRDGSPRGAVRKPSLRLMLVAQIFTAGICCAVVVISASNGRLLVPGIVFIGVLVVALLGLCIGMFSGLPKTEPRNAEGYHHGLYYADPEDPALFVPKRSGLGYTLNFGHPAAVPVMIALAVLPLVASLAAVMLR